jgi:K+/H+ antiporter YhaU regulatory subunit KhtT
MNAILADLLQRLTKEAKVTVMGTREAVLAIAERVNRKTQTLRLHWHASTLMHQMEHVSRGVGQTLCDLCDLVSESHSTGMMAPITEMTAHTRLIEAATAARSLKQELMRVEESIRELEVEALHEALINIQRDLMSRSAGLSRLVIAPDSSVVGLSLAQLKLPESTHAAALLRGSAVLSHATEHALRAGDIVILIGPQAELSGIRARFMSRRESESNKGRGKNLVVDKS